jgi:penicillin amidase
VRGRTIAWLVGILLGLILIVTLIIGISAWRAFPETDGTLYLSDLDGAVDIYRDQLGIPHIFATTDHDLFFAQGYVHAQDRFWQMDFWRHQGAGRLSELMGAATLETDIFLRTLGWERVARKELEMLDPEYLAVLEAYSAGVNAYLEERSGARLGLEYLFLNIVNRDYTPQPWEPINTLTWQKAMAWDLGGGDLNLELNRAQLSKTMSPEQIDFFYPQYPSEHPVIVPNLSQEEPSEETGLQAPGYLQAVSPALEELRAILADEYLARGSFPGIGSNSWAVAGALTDTGEPYLANDPHLGQQIPSIWYQISLHCVQITPDCQFDLVGFSFAGVPGVVIGHNDSIAWGFTNIGPDVLDLYIEKINPDDPDQYEYQGEWMEMDTVTEIIEVAGDVSYELTVQITNHGPLITSVYGLTDTLEGSELELPEQYALALRWTALEPTFVFQSLFDLNLAKDWYHFRNAARDFAVPAQNWLYADIYGNIGYQMPGNIPIRTAGDFGKYPKPGWTGEYDWQGYIPFEDLPYAFNPSEGYIVTANNAVAGPEYPYFITDNWAHGWRAQRIVDMLNAETEVISLEDMQAMQGDNYNMIAEILVPILLDIDLAEVLENPDVFDPDEIERIQGQISHLESTRGILVGWDFQNDLDSAPAALFNAFWKHLVDATFNDQLPEFAGVGYGSKAMLLIRELVEEPSNIWWDDYDTRLTEDRDKIMVFALNVAVEELEDDYGSDPQGWAWGELHTITFAHSVMDSFPVINYVFNRGPYQTAGGNSIVNATGWGGESYKVGGVPSMRMVVDLSNLSNSFTMHTTGQSGHAFNTHYKDMIDSWRLIDYYPMLWERDMIELNSEEHLRMEP